MSVVAPFALFGTRTAQGIVSPQPRHKMHFLSPLSVARTTSTHFIRFAISVCVCARGARRMHKAAHKFSHQKVKRLCNFCGFICGFLLISRCRYLFNDFFFFFVILSILLFSLSYAFVLGAVFHV